MMAGTSASLYWSPRRWRISSANSAEPTGAPNRTANAAAMPAIVTQRVSASVNRRPRATTLDNDPQVVTSGASGPAAPPAAIVTSDIGTSDRKERTLDAPPDT